MRFALVACGALALAGCQTVSTTPPVAAVPASAVDVKIAQVSKELADQCALLKTGIILARAFVDKERVQKTLVVAEAARSEFCAAPPTDVVSAIQTVAAMALAVNRALKEQPL